MVSENHSAIGTLEGTLGYYAMDMAVGCRFISTKEGYIGFGPSSSQPGE